MCATGTGTRARQNRWQNLILFVQFDTHCCKLLQLEITDMLGTEFVTFNGGVSWVQHPMAVVISPQG